MLQIIAPKLVPRSPSEDMGELTQQMFDTLKRAEILLNDQTEFLSQSQNRNVAGPIQRGEWSQNLVRNGDFASTGNPIPFWEIIGDAGFDAGWIPNWAAVANQVPGVNRLQIINAAALNRGVRVHVPGKPGGNFALAFWIALQIQGAGIVQPYVTIKDGSGTVLRKPIEIGTTGGPGPMVWSAWPAARIGPVFWTLPDGQNESVIDFVVPGGLMFTALFQLAGVSVMDGRRSAPWKPSLRGEAASNEGTDGQVLVKDSTQPTKSKYAMVGTGGSIQEEQFVPAALQTVFTLANNYKANGLKTVFINGVELEHNIDYNLPGGSPTLTFLNNGYTLDVTDFVWVIYERE